ncbi:hypothetical protein, partial [Flectobacillus longus]|uniref:hypothetical protein n=1 Tax=Flectobacillus longus TaxID=2984207 RepID=UPI0024B82425
MELFTFPYVVVAHGLMLLFCIILNDTEPCKTQKATLLEWLIYFVIFWSFFTFPHLIAVSSTVLGLTTL